MNKGMRNSDLAVWRTFATTFEGEVITRVGADDDDLMWSRQSEVTGLTGRTLGSDPCRTRLFCAPKHPYRLLGSFCPPIQRGPASVPSSVQRPGREVGQSLIRMLRTCGSATVACVGTALFFKEVYRTESIYSVYEDNLHNCPCNQFE
jgi:hypothetical protein